MEAAEEVQGQLLPHREFKASMVYVTHCLKNRLIFKCRRKEQNHCLTYFEHSSKAWQSVCWKAHTSSKFPNKQVNSTVLRLNLKKDMMFQLIEWKDVSAI